MKRLKPDFTVLDGLRGIAALYVVINHCRGHLTMGGTEYARLVPLSQWSITDKLYYSALQLTSLGREFVIFFFVLSGFSIAHSLTGKNKNFFSFYQRRLVRLYPPYVAALAWAALVFFIVQQREPLALGPGSYSVFHDTNTILSNLIYIPKGSLIGQFWSLTHEVIFYIIIPVFFLLPVRYYIGLSIIGFLIGLVISPNEAIHSTILADFFLEYNIFFALGILLYANYERVAKWFTLKKWTFFLASGGLFLAMVVTKFKLGDYNKVSVLLAAVLSILMVVNFLHYAIKGRILDFFGRMSYTLYIVHLASVYLFMVVLGSFGYVDFHLIRNPYIWMIGVVFCVLTAIPLYYLAEHPTKKILSRMRN